MISSKTHRSVSCLSILLSDCFQRSGEGSNINTRIQYFSFDFLIRKSGKKSEVNFCQVATAREIYPGSAGSTMGAIESMNEAVICSLIGM